VIGSLRPHRSKAPISGREATALLEQKFSTRGHWCQLWLVARWTFGGGWGGDVASPVPSMPLQPGIPPLEMLSIALCPTPARAQQGKAASPGAGCGQRQHLMY